MGIIWRDKSGNGNHFRQPDSANFPAYMRKAINDRNALRFDGANDTLLAAGPLLNETHTLFVVFQPTLENAAGTLLSQYAPSESGYVYFMANMSCARSTSNGNFFTDINGTTDGACASGGGSGRAAHVSISAQPILVCSALEPGSEGWQTYKDGDLIDSMTPPASLYKGVPMQIGGLSTGTNFFDGWVLELLLLDGYKADDALRQEAESYFAEKWGISLPSGHPFELHPSGWTPADISSLLTLWLDADDPETYTQEDVQTAESLYSADVGQRMPAGSTPAIRAGNVETALASGGGGGGGTTNPTHGYATSG